MKKSKLFEPVTPAHIAGLHYLGGGFLPGVPARDLTPLEVERYGRDILLATGLYVKLPGNEEDNNGGH